MADKAFKYFQASIFGNMSPKNEDCDGDIFNKGRGSPSSSSQVSSDQWDSLYLSLRWETWVGTLVMRIPQLWTNYLRWEIFCRKLFDPLSGGRSGSVCLVIITLLSKYENIITRISITTLVWTNHDCGDDYEFRIYLTVYIWRCETDQMTQETVIWIPVLRRVSHPSR